ncbi:MAG: hypothetical protein AAF492_29645 [Verrucomicrobiota bacterium]
MHHSQNARSRIVAFGLFLFLAFGVQGQFEDRFAEAGEIAVGEEWELLVSVPEFSVNPGEISGLWGLPDHWEFWGDWQNPGIRRGTVWGKWVAPS